MDSTPVSSSLLPPFRKILFLNSYNWAECWGWVSERTAKKPHPLLLASSLRFFTLLLFCCDLGQLGPTNRCPFKRGPACTGAGRGRSRRSPGWNKARPAGGGWARLAGPRVRGPAGGGPGGALEGRRRCHPLYRPGHEWVALGRGAGRHGLHPGRSPAATARPQRSSQRERGLVAGAGTRLQPAQPHPR